MQIHLPLPKTNQITHLIHLSDIHIKTGDLEKSRFMEYVTVFENLFQKLGTLDYIQQQKTVIIITGDLFENKSRIESPGIKLFNILISGLSNLAPVYLILGNHDYRQDQSFDAPDLISSLLYRQPYQNVFYLDKSGHYIAGNIGFGLVSVKETLKVGDTCGHVDQLPPFPDPLDFPPHIETKIALFHGTVSHSTLQNYRTATNGYPLEWFTGYNICLLGDVHLQQLHDVTKISDDTHVFTDSNQPWAYSGSLIQQNFGEQLTQHGILVWNLPAKTITSIDIKNDFGLLNVKYEQGQWYGLDRKWQLLKFLKTNPNFPNNLIVKNKTHSPTIDSNELKAILCDHSKKITIINDPFNSTDEQMEITQETVTEKENTYLINNSPETWIQYIETNQNQALAEINWKQWVTHPETLTIDPKLVHPSLTAKIDERNRETIKLSEHLADDLVTHQNKINRPSFRLKNLKWQWILCYKNENWFDFEQINGHICTINAKNDSGKSSFLEIICIALFGESIPSRYNREFSGSIICDQKPPNESANIKIEFIIGDETYQINRTLDKKGSGNDQNQHTKLHMRCNELSKLNENGVFELLKSGVIAVSSWVKDNLGELDTFLLSSMVTQNVDKDFFKMDKKEQLMLLDNTLHFESVNTMSAILKQSLLSYKYVIDQIKTLENHINQIIKPFEQDVFITRQKQITGIKTQLAEQETQIQQLPSEWPHINQSDFDISDQLINTKIIGLHTIIEQTLVDDTTDQLLQQKGILLKKIKECDQLADHTEKLNLPTLLDELRSLEANNISSIKCDTQTIEQTQRYLTKLKQECHKFVTTHNSSSAIIGNQIALLEQQINTKEHQLKQHYEHSPPKPTKTKQMYKQFKKNFDQQLSELNNKYQSVEQLKDFCRKHPLTECSIDPSELKQLAHQINKEKKLLIQDHPDWMSMSYQEIDQYWHDINKKNNLYQQQTQQLNQTIKNTEQQLLQINEQRKENTTQLKQLKQQKVTQPSQTLDDCIQWLENYTKLVELSDQYINLSQQLDQKNNQYIKLSSQIDEYNCQKSSIVQQLAEIDAQHYPFNPECHACQKQPWRLHENKLRQKLTQILVDLPNTQQLLDLIQYDKREHVTVKQWIDDFNHAEKQKDIWLDIKHQWELFLPIEHQIKDIEQIIEQLQQNSDQLYQTITDLNQQQYNINEQMKSLSQTLTQITYLRDNYLRWIQTENLIQKQQKIVANYQKHKTAHNVYQNYQQLCTEEIVWHTTLDQLQQYEQWFTQKTSLEDQLGDDQHTMDQLKQTLNEYLIYDQNCQHLNELTEQSHIFEQWQKWNQRLMIVKCQINQLRLIEIESKLETIQQYTQANIELNYWTSVQQQKPIFSKKQELLHIIEHNKNNLTQKLIEFEKLNCERIEYDKLTNNLQQLQTSIIHLSSIKSGIETVSEIFSGYRQWLYKKIVVPKILEITNRLAHSITDPFTSQDTQNYQLIAEINENNTFSWFISDGFNKVIIDKAGGFRKSIFALSLRIAIASLGMSGVRCRQLFLDELFTAADSDNLHMMPQLINNLLGLYNSVVLVSHLETIKETATINVSIQRFPEKLSRLQFGTQSTHKKKLNIPKPFMLSLKKIVSSPASTPEKDNSSSDRCQMILKSGKRCGNKITFDSHCWRHLDKMNT